MAIKTIVVGIDFSEESEIALAQAHEIARHTGARLVLVHAGVVPEEPIGVPEGMSSTVDAYRSELRERLGKDRETLESIRQRRLGQGAELSNMVIEGFPDTALCKASEDLDADLVAVGTHGQTGLKRFLLGSVAERVVRLCSCKVLVARQGKDVYGKILVATDFSESAHTVVKAAIEVAGPGAQIDLLYCWNLPVMASSYYAPASAETGVTGPLREGIIQAAEEKAAELIKQYQQDDVELSFTTVQAPPAYGIQEKAEEGKYDLVVMGSHGRRGVRRWILGSVAEVTVRHAPCSVLVVHPEDAH
ncbi:MAG: universal stress protein [Deltaproteobacteria bacterium]|nr:universal stress protein [Deltaproteobacteria bacterium]